MNANSDGRPQRQPRRIESAAAWRPERRAARGMKEGGESWGLWGSPTLGAARAVLCANARSVLVLACLGRLLAVLAVLFAIFVVVLFAVLLIELILVLLVDPHPALQVAKEVRAAQTRRGGGQTIMRRCREKGAGARRRGGLAAHFITAASLSRYVYWSSSSSWSNSFAHLSDVASVGLAEPASRARLGSRV